MAKILAPNNEYVGVSASVTFAKGVGETSNPILIQWFKEKGYTVVDEESSNELDGESKDSGEKSLEEMDVEELMLYAQEKGIDIGKSTSQEGILKKIHDAENVE